MGILEQISEIEACVLSLPPPPPPPPTHNSPQSPFRSEMARTQKNKATEYHLGRLKAKLAKLKSELMGIGTKSGGKAGDGFDVTKSGDTRVGLIGFPSVGKSTLLTVLTGTESEAASYE